MKKKFYLILIVFFSCSNCLIAQGNLGVTFNQTIDFIDVVNYNFTIGVKSNIKIKNRFSLNVGLGYGKENYNIEKDWIMYFYSTYFESKNIKTDCHLRFNIVDKNDKFLFYCLAGPSINVNFYEKSRSEFGGNDLFEVIENKIRLYNLLIVAGLGIEYKIKKISLSIEPTLETQLWRNRETGRNINFVSFDPYRIRMGINLGVSYFFNKKNKKSD